jgi:hypothetical protein
MVPGRVHGVYDSRVVARIGMGIQHLGRLTARAEPETRVGSAKAVSIQTRGFDFKHLIGSAAPAEDHRNSIAGS